VRTGTEHLPASGERRPSTERTSTAIVEVATLVPDQVPGRLTRKARHYLPQIVRLRAEGFTLEAIQHALAAVGIPVSISTVRRESMRPLPSARVPIAATTASIQPVATSPPAGAVQRAAAPVISGFLDSGKDIAAAYAQSKSGNPLTRTKENL
jgi:hypothetical protein